MAKSKSSPWRPVLVRIPFVLLLALLACAWAVFSRDLVNLFDKNPMLAICCLFSIFAIVWAFVQPLEKWLFKEEIEEEKKKKEKEEKKKKEKKRCS